MFHGEGMPMLSEESAPYAATCNGKYTTSKSIKHTCCTKEFLASSPQVYLKTVPPDRLVEYLHAV